MKKDSSAPDIFFAVDFVRKLHVVIFPLPLELTCLVVCSFYVWIVAAVTDA